MNQRLQIAPLASHPEVLLELRQWFESEWPEYYGEDGPGNAEADLAAFSGTGRLPVGIVAFQEGELCGVAVLKSESIASHRHLSPWAAAGLVKGAKRGKGIGAELLHALEQEARRLGFNSIYCATATSESLLQRGGWELLERIEHQGEQLGVYQKQLHVA
ncbi:MAG: GNAT family N-acetyltransferase [Armatimonadetes bacterium]|nr:GNAT family N-acetyltransferase [Armatimonadota bacterium]